MTSDCSNMIRDYMKKHSKGLEDSIIDLIEKRFPSSVETVESVRKRIDLFKIDLNSYMEQNKPEGKVGIVSHSAVLRIITTPSEYWQ